MQQLINSFNIIDWLNYVLFHNFHKITSYCFKNIVNKPIAGNLIQNHI